MDDQPKSVLRLLTLICTYCFKGHWDMYRALFTNALSYLSWFLAYTFVAHGRPTQKCVTPTNSNMHILVQRSLRYVVLNGYAQDIHCEYVHVHLDSSEGGTIATQPESTSLHQPMHSLSTMNMGRTLKSFVNFCTCSLLLWLHGIRITKCY